MGRGAGGSGRRTEKIKGELHINQTWHVRAGKCQRHPLLCTVTDRSIQTQNSNPVLGSLRLAEDMASKFRSADAKSKTPIQPSLISCLNCWYLAHLNFGSYELQLNLSSLTANNPEYTFLSAQMF